jgi:cobalt-precorrin-5B (C1)-methyltransferase
MMGKFSKLAQGVLMVHSKSAPVDFGFLAKVAEEAGVPVELKEEILSATTASYVGDLMMAQGYRHFFARLCQYCCDVGLRHIGGGLELETVITTMKGELLGRESRYGASNQSDRDR